MQNKILDAEVNYDSKASKEDLQNMKPIKRTKTILVVKALEKLTPEENGVELNEGYEYETNGAIPQIADGIAKMAIEMDKLPDMGQNAGGAFVSLIVEYYTKLKGGE